MDMSLSKHDTPMTQGDHPELDDSVLLDDNDHTKCLSVCSIGL
jgi:hypothetical protein